MSIRKRVECARDGITPLRVYHDNDDRPRKTATYVWTHPLDESCVACDTGGKRLPAHIKKGLPRPEGATT